MMRKTKRFAEGGKAKLSDTEFALGNLSPAFGISKMMSGEAGITDFGIPGAFNRFLAPDQSNGQNNLTDEEKVRVRAMLAAQGQPPMPGMKKGGAVKKMAAGGQVRGCGIAARGHTKGRVR